MKKVNLIAAWVLGIIIFASAIAVAQYYYYITPPHDLQVDPNECFSKTTETEIAGLVKNNLAKKIYNGLNASHQRETNVKSIEKMLTTTIYNRFVQSVNHSAGGVTCIGNFKTVVQFPNKKKSIKTALSGSYSLHGTETGILYQIGDGIVSNTYTLLNNQL